MNLILDQDNRIIGVDDDKGNYQYDGYVPDDFAQHKDDGCYMIRYGMIMHAPIVSDSTEESTPSQLAKQVNELAIAMMVMQMQGGAKHE